MGALREYRGFFMITFPGGNACFSDDGVHDLCSTVGGWGGDDDETLFPFLELPHFFMIGFDVMGGTGLVTLAFSKPALLLALSSSTSY